MFKTGDKVQLIGFPPNDPKYQSIGIISFTDTIENKTTYYVTVNNYLPMAVSQANLRLIE